MVKKLKTENYKGYKIEFSKTKSQIHSRIIDFEPYKGKVLKGKIKSELLKEVKYLIDVFENDKKLSKKSFIEKPIQKGYFKDELIELYPNGIYSVFIKNRYYKADTLKGIKEIIIRNK